MFFGQTGCHKRSVFSGQTKRSVSHGLSAPKGETNKFDNLGFFVYPNFCVTTKKAENSLYFNSLFQKGRRSRRFLFLSGF